MDLHRNRTQKKQLIRTEQDRGIVEQKRARGSRDDCPTQPTTNIDGDLDYLPALPVNPRALPIPTPFVS
ncbi:hypothetical protein ACFX2F_027466 [Malus domestica]